MAGRDLSFVTGYYYHVFNRGVARQPTFLDQRDYKRALESLWYYRYLPKIKLSRYLELSVQERSILRKSIETGQDPLVEIAAYALMPNHFHLLIKQLHDGGVTRFLSNFSNSYSRYFNTRQNREGPIFQGVFKAVLIESQEQLIHVSRYIHINPAVAGLIKRQELVSYPWTSLSSFQSPGLVNINPTNILASFSSYQNYLDFVLAQVDYGVELERINHLAIDIEW